MNSTGQGKRTLTDRLQQVATEQEQALKRNAAAEHDKTLTRLKAETENFRKLTQAEINKTLEALRTESKSLRASISADLNTTKSAIQDQLKLIKNYWIACLAGIFGLMVIGVLIVVAMSVWSDREITQKQEELRTLNQAISTTRSTLQTLEDRTSGVIIFSQNNKKYIVLPSGTDLKKPLSCKSGPCVELPSQQ